MLSPLEKRTSISIPLSLTDQILVKPRIIKTKLFEGMNFYIDKSKLKEKNYKEIMREIKTNGGNTYDKISNSLGRVYAPMPDAMENPELRLRVSKYQSIMEFVSFRWVYHCVSKAEIIPPTAEDYYIFRAFDFPVPLPSFFNLRFEMIGVPRARKQRLRELVDVLGSKKHKANKH